MLPDEGDSSWFHLLCSLFQCDFLYINLSSKMAPLLWLALLVQFRAHVEAYNMTNVEKVSDENLIFGYLTPTAATVIAVVAVTLTSCTIMTCYFDFNKMKQGIGNLEMCEERGEGLSYETFETVSAERPLLPEEGSGREESTQGAVKPADLESDVAQISKIAITAPRLDAEAKQARIIEAIYQASGREVPDMYRSKVKPRRAIVVPPIEIHETVEGIAEKETHEPGSPVQLFTLPQPKSPVKQLSTRSQQKADGIPEAPTQPPSRELSSTALSSVQSAPEVVAQKTPSEAVISTRTGATQSVEQLAHAKGGATTKSEEHLPDVAGERSQKRRPETDSSLAHSQDKKSL